MHAFLSRQVLVCQFPDWDVEIPSRSSRLMLLIFFHRSLLLFSAHYLLSPGWVNQWQFVAAGVFPSSHNLRSLSISILCARMAAFDTSEMADALPEVTNAGTTGRTNAETAALIREKGWAAPEQYDYARYSAPNAIKHPEWASNAAKYEWKDEYGDVGPADPELEEMLFRNDLINRPGLKLDTLRGIKVTAESIEQPKPIKSFDDAGLHPIMRENIRLCGYQIPTPIQAYSIPAIITGHDLIAVAQTGSGKTAAFFIPVLSQLMGKAKKLAAARPNLAAGFNPATDAVTAEPLVLVIAPTRELATQIFDEARRLCYRSMLRPCVVYGGGPVSAQRLELQKGCDILIGTPGRLLDFMGKPHILSLRRVKYTIIDEADEMLHSDWEQELGQLLSGGDSNEDADHRYMMFSATFNKSCRELARKYLAIDHVRIRVGRAGSTHQNITQRIIYAEEEKKKQCLFDLLMSMPPSRTLVFVNSKVQADLVDDYLYNMGFQSTSIHSDRNQLEREDAIRAFRSAKSPILVATGVSARGLDIRNVMHVINYDLPRVDRGGIDEYVHRIGRTARIGNEGLATSLYNHEKDAALAPDLVKILLESNQEVPDFLQDCIPTDGVLQFDDDTDAEGEDQNDKQEASGDSWSSWQAANAQTENGGSASFEATTATAPRSFSPVQDQPGDDYNW
ncbi:hypothetical protein VTN31DRAFT_5399 [Thermomyces dupontii]|uniref:uncharacterized protein n=1 Tax=Talaromyces thermophilus TaxID=28565 RepID=UPI0037446F7D